MIQCFQHPGSVIKLYVCSHNLLQQSFLCINPGGVLYRMTSLPFGHYGYEDIFRHFCAAQLKRFVIKRWSLRRKGGRSESKQLKFSIIFSPHCEQILIGNDVCVNLTRALSPHGQTERHPRQEKGGRGESFERGVEDGGECLRWIRIQQCISKQNG